MIAQTPSGYAGWVATQYPAANEGPLGDHEKDGLANGVEYAFGLNPLVPNAGSALPQPARVGNTFIVTYTQPATITDVTYSAQWTTDFVMWNPIADTGSGSTHTFTVSTAGQPKMFFRHRIVIAP